MGINWASCSTNGVATLTCIPLVIADLIWWALTFASLVALFFIIVAGYKYITSQGDPKKIDEARKTIGFAILGLTVVFLSFFIVNFIATTTGVGCLNTSTPLSFTSCQ